MPKKLDLNKPLPTKLVRELKEISKLHKDFLSGEKKQKKLAQKLVKFMSDQIK